MTQAPATRKLRRRFGEITLGDAFYSDGVTITEAHIVAYAGLAGDFYALHMDREYAASTQFGQRLAHGLLVFSVGVGRIATEIQTFDVVAAMGFSKLRFKAPVFIGDTVCSSVVVTDLKSRGDTGVVTFDLSITSQRDEVVISAVHDVLVRA